MTYPQGIGHCATSMENAMRQIQIGDLVSVSGQGYTGQVMEVTNISYSNDSDIPTIEVDYVDYISAELCTIVETKS